LHIFGTPEHEKIISGKLSLCVFGWLVACLCGIRLILFVFSI
jgi:hypothetical protein